MAYLNEQRGTQIDTRLRVGRSPRLLIDPRAFRRLVALDRQDTKGWSNEEFALHCGVSEADFFAHFIALVRAQEVWRDHAADAEDPLGTLLFLERTGRLADPEPGFGGPQPRPWNDGVCVAWGWLDEDLDPLDQRAKSYGSGGTFWTNYWAADPGFSARAAAREH